jgi:ABC-2 type transport system ATP-binding protein
VIESAICIESLTRDFGSVRAVDHLSLEVPAGTIFGFLGPNGSGKTTTIHLLMGLLEPTAGRARVLGFDTVAEAEEIRARTGTLLEHPGLYEQMTAEENLAFYGRVWRVPASERQHRIEELLTEMGVWDRRKERVSKWSRGMKQKLAMARAMIHRPPLVFLDEPTAGLDVIAATALREDLAAMAAREGVTIFLTTHNMAEAEKLCDQVAVLRQGSLVALGAPDTLRARAVGVAQAEIVGSGFTEDMLVQLRARTEVATAEIQNGRLSIQLHEETDIAPLVTQVVAAGGQVEEIRRGKASLEEVFLTLMEEEK